MAKYEVTAPDGTKFQITAPDNASEADVLNYAQTQFKARQPDPPMNPVDDMSRTQKFLAGAGKAMVDIGRGAGQLVGLVSDQDVVNARERDKPLMQTGWGTAGNITGGIATALPAMFIPGANTVAGAGAVGAAMGALQPTVEGESRLKNAAIGGGLGAASQYGTGKVLQYANDRLANTTQALASQQAQNATRDAVAKSSQQAGYVIPPTQANPTALNKALEGMAGKISTAQSASIKNQGVTDALIRKEFNLTPDTPLIPATFENIRKKAGTAYQALKSIPQFAADDEFAAAVSKLGGEYRQIAQEVPELANGQIDNLVSALNKQAFTGETTVGLLKKLRFDGGKNIANLDPEKSALGRAQIEAANALEGLVERNLVANNAKGTLDAFRKARETIAKSHSVEQAINSSTGTVNAQKLASQLKKGAPLSGEIKKAAEFANAFPKAAQEVNSSMPGVSPLDYMAGILGTGTMGPAGALAVGARPAARSVILSPTFQGSLLTPKYTPGMADTLPPKLLSEIERLGAGGLLGPSAYFAHQ